MIFKDMKMYGHLNMDTSEALLQNIINFEEKKKKKEKKGSVWNNLKLLSLSSKLSFQENISRDGTRI